VHALLLSGAPLGVAPAGLSPSLEGSAEEESWTGPGPLALHLRWKGRCSNPRSFPALRRSFVDIGEKGWYHPLRLPPLPLPQLVLPWPLLSDASASLESWWPRQRHRLEAPRQGSNCRFICSVSCCSVSAGDLLGLRWSGEAAGPTGGWNAQLPLPLVVFSLPLPLPPLLLHCVLARHVPWPASRPPTPAASGLPGLVACCRAFCTSAGMRPSPAVTHGGQLAGAPCRFRGLWLLLSTRASACHMALRRQEPQACSDVARTQLWEEQY